MCVMCVMCDMCDMCDLCEFLLFLSVSLLLQCLPTNLDNLIKHAGTLRSGERRKGDPSCRVVGTKSATSRFLIGGPELGTGKHPQMIGYPYQLSATDSRLTRLR